MSNILHEGLKRYLPDSSLQKLTTARVGIAGAGGLGSNLAMMLARSGIKNMILIDHDLVEPSNLNRQHFWPRHVGMKKVDALADVLLELNPDLNLQLLPVFIDEHNLLDLLGDCPIWAEALDTAQNKAMFVQQALAHGCKVVSASGLCGIGGPAMRKRQIGNLTIAGDFCASLEIAPPMAPRVTQAAAMMADTILELILKAEATS